VPQQRLQLLHGVSVAALGRRGHASDGPDRVRAGKFRFATKSELDLERTPAWEACARIVGRDGRVPSTAPARRLPSDPTRRHARARAPLWLRENAALGSASASGVNRVRQTAHVAFCGKYDTRIPGRRDPEPMSEAKRASLLGSFTVPVDGARHVAIGVYWRGYSRGARDGVAVVTGTVTSGRPHIRSRSTR
jgi:hypothetical protein